MRGRGEVVVETGTSQVPEGCMEVMVKLVWSMAVLGNFSVSPGQPGSSLSAFQPSLCSPSALSPSHSHGALPPSTHLYIQEVCAHGLPHPGFADLLLHHPLAPMAFLSMSLLTSQKEPDLFHSSDHRPLWIGFPQPWAQPLASHLRLWGCVGWGLFPENRL